MSPAIAQAVRRNRESLGLSISTLAKHAALAEGELKAFEQGTVELPAVALTRLARTMGLPSTVFLVDELARSSVSAVEGARFFHAESTPVLSETDVVTIARELSRAEVFADLVQRRLDLDEFHPRPPAQRAWRSGYDFAGTMRTKLGLGTASVRSLQSLLEDDLGILVIRHAFADARLRAVAVRGEKGRLIVVSKSLSKALFRVSLAHELCHQLCDLAPNRARSDEDQGERDGISKMETAEEQRAKAFAVMFLAPANLVHGLFGQALHQFVTPTATLEAVSLLAKSSGIGPVAALWHLFHLEYLTDQDGDVEQMSRRILADATLDDFEPALGGPDGLIRAIDRALAAEEIDLDQAERLRVL